MLKIYGESDDLIEVEGSTRGEIDRCGHPILLRIGDAKRGCYLLWRYADDAFKGSGDSEPEDIAPCWTVGIIAIDSGDGDTGAPLPAMRIEMGGRHGGVCVVIDEDLPIVEIREGQDCEIR